MISVAFVLKKTRNLHSILSEHKKIGKKLVLDNPCCYFESYSEFIFPTGPVCF